MVDLFCTSCHLVAGDGELPQPVSANPGPILGTKHAVMAPGALASSVVSLSHIVTEAIAARSGGSLSPMGDFSDAMTVRQLVDLVAYLRSLKAR